MTAYDFIIFEIILKNELKLKCNFVAVSPHYISKIIPTISILVPQPPSRKMTSSGVGKARAAFPKQIPKTTITKILLGINILCANIEMKFETDLLFTIHFWWDTEYWLFSNRLIPTFLCAGFFLLETFFKEMLMEDGDGKILWLGRSLIIFLASIDRHTFGCIACNSSSFVWILD